MSQILPMPTTGSPAPASASRTVGAGGGMREVAAVVGALERAGLADERARDHAARCRSSSHSSRAILADAIQLGERDDLLVRGDLEHAVGRGVDDRLAGAHVLGAELVEDLGAGGGLVAERAARRWRAAKRSMISAGKPSGTWGRRFSTTRPAISQWPVVVSLPARASRILPKAPSVHGDGRDAEDGREVADAEALRGAAA